MTQFGPGFVAGGDPLTKILMHMDGANGGTVFTDSVNPSRVWSPSGLVITNNGQVKFGATALDCGLGQGSISCPNDPSFAIGTNDFTVDCWFWVRGQVGTGRRMFGNTLSGGYVIQTIIDSTDHIWSQISVGGTGYIVTGGPTYLANSGWHHYALVRNGTTLTLYLDGTSVSTAALPVGGVIPTPNEPFSIGNIGPNTGNYWCGWIDEFRFSVGIARWTANFTPPTAPYV